MDIPHLKMYSGLSSYKNVKSGNYNRQPCWTCHNFKGFPQTAGLFDLNVIQPNQQSYQLSTPKYYSMNSNRQAHRLDNHSGTYKSGYVNYLNQEQTYLYPKRYIKGFWPDEQLIYTNTPSNPLIRDIPSLKPSSNCVARGALR